VRGKCLSGPTCVARNQVLVIAVTRPRAVQPIVQLLGWRCGTTCVHVTIVIWVHAVVVRHHQILGRRVSIDGSMAIAQLRVAAAMGAAVAAATAAAAAVSVSVSVSVSVAVSALPRRVVARCNAA
jgi:hypothetical protein